MDERVETRQPVLGLPVRCEPWPTYDKGAVFVEPEDEEAALRAVRAHRFFRYDSREHDQTECARFEAGLCCYFGVRHALAVSSGTAALALMIMAAGIPPGSLIACPGFGFPATPSAILLAGCTPFLVEVDENLHFDLDDLAGRWTPLIKAILVVHMRGLASDVTAIGRFADRMGVPMFEDAVPALGAELNGRKLGTFGLAGGFSTQSDKSLNCGEGGFLLTDDSTLYARAVVLSGAYEGRYERHFPDGDPPIASDLDLPLFNFRMDEIRAALLGSELARLPVRLASFSRNYDYVTQGLADLDAIAIRRQVAPGARLGEALVFRVTHGDAQEFADGLCREGIEARNFGSATDCNVRAFWHWRFLFPGLQTAQIKALLPATTHYLEQAVDVPLSSTLSLADCDELVTAVRKVAASLLPHPRGSAAAGRRRRTTGRAPPRTRSGSSRPATRCAAARTGSAPRRHPPRPAVAAIPLRTQSGVSSYRVQRPQGPFSSHARERDSHPSLVMLGS